MSVLFFVFLSTHNKSQIQKSICMLVQIIHVQKFCGTRPCVMYSKSTSKMNFHTFSCQQFCTFLAQGIPTQQYLTANKIFINKNPTIYNIIRWLSGSLGQTTKRLMFQVLFSFHNFLKNSLQKSLKIKSFEQLKTIRSYEKNNAWNIRRLVDELFVPVKLHLILLNRHTVFP